MPDFVWPALVILEGYLGSRVVKGGNAAPGPPDPNTAIIPRKHQYSCIYTPLGSFRSWPEPTHQNPGDRNRSSDEVATIRDKPVCDPAPSVADPDEEAACEKPR